MVDFACDTFWHMDARTELVELFELIIALVNSTVPTLLFPTGDSNKSSWYRGQWRICGHAIWSQPDDRVCPRQWTRLEAHRAPDQLMRLFLWHWVKGHSKFSLVCPVGKLVTNCTKTHCKCNLCMFLQGPAEEPTFIRVFKAKYLVVPGPHVKYSA